MFKRIIGMNGWYSLVIDAAASLAPCLKSAPEKRLVKFTSADLDHRDTAYILATDMRQNAGILDSALHPAAAGEGAVTNLACNANIGGTDSNRPELKIIIPQIWFFRRISLCLRINPR